jgi:Ran GTPase-activating protein (RanGAP) involved in mRNA processing and transport
MLAVNQVLASLNLASNNLSSFGVDSLATALETNVGLTQLSLAANSIGQGGAAALAEMLKVNSSLKSLSISRNATGTQAEQCFAAALLENKTLTELDLDQALAGLDAVVPLIHAARQHDQLTSLRCAAGDLGDAGANEVAEYVQASTSLTTLSLSADQLIGTAGQRNWERLKTLLSISTYKVGLMHGHKRLSRRSEQHVQELTAHLGRSRSAIEQHLQVHAVRLVDYIARARTMASAIVSCASLKTLILCSRFGGETHECTLDIRRLKGVDRIETLDLSRAYVDLSAAVVIGCCLAANSELQSLNMSENPALSDEALKAIGTALLESQVSKLVALRCDQFEVPIGSTTLHLSGGSERRIGSGAGILLAALLKHNQQLTELDLHGNQINGSTCAALVDALAAAESLKTLDLSGNPLGTEGWHAIGDTLHRLEALETLKLSDTNERALLNVDTLIAIDTLGATALGDGIRAQEVLRVLDVSHVTVSEAGAEHLAQAVIASGDLEDISGVPIGALRSANEPMRAMNLQAHGLGTTEGLVLAKCVEANSGLHTLDISENPALSDAALEAIGLALLDSPVSNVSELRWKEFEVRTDATILKWGIADKCSGLRWTLAAGEKQASGKELVNHVLAKRLSQKQLEASTSEGPSGYGLLTLELSKAEWDASWASSGMKLESFHVSAHHFVTSGTATFEPFVEPADASKGLGPVGATLLAGVLMSNRSLTELQLANHSLDPKAGEVLARALMVNPVVRTCDLRGRSNRRLIHHEGARDALRRAVATRRRLPPSGQKWHVTATVDAHERGEGEAPEELEKVGRHRIHNEALEKALERALPADVSSRPVEGFAIDFTRREWDSFGVRDLGVDSFVELLVRSRCVFLGAYNEALEILTDEGTVGGEGGL